MLWPLSLWLLGLIPILIGLYIWVLRRRRRYAVRFSSLGLVRAALPRRNSLRRHIPFALFLLALTSLTVALARPLATITVPVGQKTVLLTIDVSRSMCSTDIPPNRLVAAQEAALGFIRSQEQGTRIGIVAFAGFAEIIQTPTDDQELLENAIETLTTARRTAIGSGILRALDGIAEFDSSVAPSNGSMAPGQIFTPVAEGSYAPNIIVLLTDGASNTGPLPLDAAQQAVERGIRVYTIGFGTANGGMMRCVQQGPGNDPQFGGRGFGNDPFGGGGGGGSNFRRGIDEDTLKEVAKLTGGEYYSAESAADLQSVFKNLPTSLITRQEHMEISFLFVAIGTLLALAAITLSIRWNAF